MVSFECDYIAGAHPEILKRLAETNMESLPGYGMDHYTENAKEKIKAACGLPDAQVEYYNGKADLVAALTGHKIDAGCPDYQHGDCFAAGAETLCRRLGCAETGHGTGRNEFADGGGA